MRLDDIEVDLLEELRKDSRISMRQLANKSEVTTPTVSSKVKKLEEMEIIKNYTINMDYRKLGFEEYIFRIECRPSDIEIIVDSLKDFEFLKEILELGGKKLQISIEVPDLKRVDSFLNLLKDTDEIEGFKFERVTKNYVEYRNIPIRSSQDLDIGCYYCRKPIEGEPVKLKMDGKEHYLCCETCAQQYEEKYKEIKNKAD